jgi:hypothetical protein
MAIRAKTYIKLVFLDELSGVLSKLNRMSSTEGSNTFFVKASHFCQGIVLIKVFGVVSVVASHVSLHRVLRSSLVLDSRLRN